MLKKVEKGQPFVPSTRFHNKVADAVNSMNGFQSGAIKSGGGKHEISITFLNTLDEDIPAGAPLVIDSDKYDEGGETFFVRKVTEEDTFYGISKTAVEKQKTGTLVLCGVVKISVSGDVSSAVIPVVDSFEWEYAEYGTTVLAPVSDGALVFIGSTASGTKKKSELPFQLSYNPETEMIDITGGYLLANGEAIKVKGDSVGVFNGTVCVTAENDKGSYKNATFKYGDFAPNCIPLGTVSKDDDGVKIINFSVSTAIMIETVDFPGTL